MADRQDEEAKIASWPLDKLYEFVRAKFPKPDLPTVFTSRWGDLGKFRSWVQTEGKQQWLVDRALVASKTVRSQEIERWSLDYDKLHAAEQQRQQQVAQARDAVKDWSPEKLFEFVRQNYQGQKQGLPIVFTYEWLLAEPSADRAFLTKWAATVYVPTGPAAVQQWSRVYDSANANATSFCAFIV